MDNGPFGYFDRKLKIEQQQYERKTGVFSGRHVWRNIAGKAGL